MSTSSNSSRRNGGHQKRAAASTVHNGNSTIVDTASLEVPSAGYAFSYSGLSDELRDFVEYVALTPEETNSRRELIQEVEHAALSLWGAAAHARVVVYGSYSLGVSLPSSDVDMAVVFRPLPELHQTTTAAADSSNIRSQIPTTILTPHELLCRLHQLSKKLNESPRLRSTVIEQCRVPVVHIDDTWSGMSGDVSMSVPDLDAVVSMQKAWLRNNAPLAKELIVLTKAALKQWGLNSSFTGGLSSTCVYLLVQRFLAEQDVMQSCQHVQHVNEQHRLLAQVLNRKDDQCENTPTSSPSSSVDGLSSPGAETTAATTPRSPGASSTVASGLFRLGGGHSRANSASLGDDEDAMSKVSCLSRVPTPSPQDAFHAYDVQLVRDESEHHVNIAANSSAEHLAKTMLAFWKYCGHEVFAAGYEVSNTFLPTVEQLLAAELSDLSKGAFRLAEVQMLFKHSVTVLEQLVVAGHTTFGAMFAARPPTPLSAVLTDPRAPSSHGSSQSIHSHRRKQRNDHHNY